MWDKLESKQISKPQLRADAQAHAALFHGFNVLATQDEKDRDFVERGYQYNPTVYAIITQTIKAASQVPWKVYKTRANGDKVEFHNGLLNSLLKKPNSWMTWGDLMQEMVGFKMLQGDTYVWGINPTGSSINAGKPVSLWPLPSQHVQIHTDTMRGISGYSLDYRGSGDWEDIDADNVMHLKDWNPDYDEEGSHLRGQSPLRALVRTLRMNNRAIDTGNAYIENVGSRGLLFDESGDDMEDLSKAQVDKLQSNYNQKHGRVENANQIAVTNGKFGFLNLMATSADIALLEQYGATKQDICNAFNFPSLLIGEGQGTYENQNEAKKAFWNDVVIPILTEIMDGLNCWLLPKFGENIHMEFDLTGVHAVQEDKLMRGKAIKEFAGMITINEARKKSGEPPFSWMKPPTSMEEFRDQMYVGFTQATVQDSEEISDINGEAEEAPKKPKPDGSNPKSPK